MATILPPNTNPTVILPSSTEQSPPPPSAVGPHVKLGDLAFRVDPNDVEWNFQLDTSVINTLGGQVVQILGVTQSDLTISGDFGQVRSPGGDSWRLAAAFHQKIKSMMDAQTQPAITVAQSTADSAKNGGQTLFSAITGKAKPLSDTTPVHNPIPLTYYDGKHNWSFKVLIKAINDKDGSGSLHVTNGKFSYSYALTLFIVQDGSKTVSKVASDIFISRIAEGIGWSQTGFNGPLSAAQAQAFIAANGGSVVSVLSNTLDGIPLVDPGGG